MDGTAGSGGGIASGIAFLNHMIDQLNSHAQLRVSLATAVGGQSLAPKSNEVSALGVDTDVAMLAGRALGAELRRLLLSTLGLPAEGSGVFVTQEKLSAAVLGKLRLPPEGPLPKFTFCAPLDESFTELSLEFPAKGDLEAVFDLAPYGIYPPSGRKYIGHFRPVLTETFFGELARSLGCCIRARKVRGENAHHIVEATFKSFARCFRSMLDTLSGLPAEAFAICSLKARSAAKSRATKETGISIDLNLDASPDDEGDGIATGLASLDLLFRELRSSSGISLRATCTGDLWIDDHHSAEDVSIALGKALVEALGDKGGACRMAFADVESGGARVRCVMDLSNRPSFHCDLRLSERGEEMVGDLSIEMIHHCFESLSLNGLMTVHLQQLDGEEQPPTARDLALAAARAFGSALRQCITIDPRRAGIAASSKGTIST